MNPLHKLLLREINKNPQICEVIDPLYKIRYITNILVFPDRIYLTCRNCHDFITYRDFDTQTIINKLRRRGLNATLLLKYPNQPYINRKTRTAMRKNLNENFTNLFKNLPH